MDGKIPIPVLIDILIPLLFVAYGWKFLSYPPDINSGKGFVSKYSLINKETWKYATKLGGILYIVLALVLGAITAVKYAVFGQTEPQWFTIVYVICVIVVYFLPFLLVRNKCRAKFGDLLAEKEAKEAAEQNAAIDEESAAGEEEENGEEETGDKE